MKDLSTKKLAMLLSIITILIVVFLISVQLGGGLYHIFEK